VGGTRSAASAGERADGMIGVTPDAHAVDVFRGSGGGTKRCVAQVHVSIATTMDEALDTAWEWWPQGVVPPKVLPELAKPGDFESIAAAVGHGSITDVVVCASDAAPIIEAIDKYIGAGFDTVYLHQVGPDQQRLADLASSELLEHYKSGGEV
jgi:hypothetical protein